MEGFEQKIPEYKKVLEHPMDFGVALKVLPSKGNLVYEYNPFRNYRLTQIGYLYKNRLFTPRELLIELGKEEYSNKTDQECLDYIKGLSIWTDLDPTSETDPVIVEEGELTDFETDELSKLIEEAEFKADNTCELCGSTENIGKKLGWITTCCEECAKKIAKNGYYEIIRWRPNNIADGLKWYETNKQGEMIPQYKEK